MFFGSEPFGEDKKIEMKLLRKADNSWHEQKNLDKGFSVGSTRLALNVVSDEDVTNRAEVISKIKNEEYIFLDWAYDALNGSLGLYKNQSDNYIAVKLCDDFNIFACEVTYIPSDQNL